MALDVVGEQCPPWKVRGAYQQVATLISYIGKKIKVQLQNPIGRSATSSRMNRKNCVFSVHTVLIDSFFFTKTLEWA
jgi:hypothetical protein